ncbi:hypothetical protein CONLIGDRAFT_686684 [Coniochaeta ligniaria NRRL 30616]|uniref:Secreted protein n=1 Tax=Coniochaeta ligniaria NRRL 30616 TaxID=1408157 RepID=A0A1J7I744_9PEZI|nr:hypothetical protein CONLIGDRAFT_686684 [Coniochaeta ligniaria NRRL 30616]
MAIAAAIAARLSRTLMISVLLPVPQHHGEAAGAATAISFDESFIDEPNEAFIFKAQRGRRMPRENLDRDGPTNSVAAADKSPGDDGLN